MTEADAKPKPPAGGPAEAFRGALSNSSGAHVVQIVSALARHGVRHLGVLRADLEAWMRENEWGSLGEMRGNMGFGRIPDPAAYERASFRAMSR